jgi:hypothetical protein
MQIGIAPPRPAPGEKVPQGEVPKL